MPGPGSPSTETASRRPRTRQWIAGLIAFALTLALAAVLVTSREVGESNDAEYVAKQQADAYAEQLVANLQPLDSAAQAVRSLILAHDGSIPEPELQGFLDELHSSISGIWLIAAAPGNRVAAIAPRAENAEALGLFYPTNPDQWPSVREAMADDHSVLVGPVDLVQGGQAFIYRTPVYTSDDRYWGVISTAADAASLLTAPAGVSPDGEASIGVRDAQGKAILGDSKAFQGVFETATRNMLDTSWDVGVTVAAQKTPVRVVRAIVGLLVAIAIGVLTFLLVGARRREQELSQLMSDVSTQAPGILFQLRGSRDGPRHLSYASPAIGTMLGITPVDGKFDSDELLKVVNPDDIPAISDGLTRSSESLQPWRQRFRVSLPDGTQRWLYVNASPELLTNGEMLWHGWASDVTQDIADEAALRVSASLFDVTRDAVAILDVDGVITFTNPGFQEVTGLTSAQAVGRTLDSLLEEVTPEQVLNDLWTQLGRHGYWSGELSIWDPDGSVRTDAAVANAVVDDGGHVSHYVVVLDNMNLTRDDPVTGLPHPRVLDESLQAALNEQPSAGGVAYVIVGLDGFRAINDAYGHRAGDRLLRAVGARLRQALPPSVPLVRLRGDEFAFVVQGAAEVSEIEISAERYLSELVAPFDISGQLIRTSAAAGIAVSEDGLTDSTELQLHANQAMRAAKRSGANQIRFFRDTMQFEAQEQALLRHELDAAIQLGQIHVVFQPIVDLHTLEVHRAEALIRWEHPIRGDIPPDVFISIAERTGRIGDLGDIAFDASVAALLLLRQTDPTFQISVNLSPVELREPGPRHLERIARLRSAGLPGDALIIEITEGVLLTSDDVVDANLLEYRNAGMQFAIDDFGTGYSSLSYLQRLDVQFLKIDRSFIDGLAPGSDGLALCQAIIVMAHKLGLGVVAEGVETAEQNLLLMQSGCDFAQGFLHARPMAVDALAGQAI